MNKRQLYIHNEKIRTKKLREDRQYMRYLDEGMGPEYVKIKDAKPWKHHLRRPTTRKAVKKMTRKERKFQLETWTEILEIILDGEEPHMFTWIGNEDAFMGIEEIEDIISKYQ